jgi:hypothetical protein
MQAIEKVVHMDKIAYANFRINKKNESFKSTKLLHYCY